MSNGGVEEDKMGYRKGSGIIFWDGIAGRSNGLVGGWSTSEVRVPFGVELTEVGCSRFGRRDGVGEELASLLLKLTLKS
jgi:hypothetical protein